MSNLETSKVIINPSSKVCRKDLFWDQSYSTSLSMTFSFYQKCKLYNYADDNTVSHADKNEEAH